MKITTITSKVAIMVISLCTLVLQAANEDVSIDNAEIKVINSEISVSPFKYKVNGKERDCSGKIFKINPTVIKNKQVDITLKSSHSDRVWVFMSGKLPARNIVDFKLVDKQGNVFKEGVDYRLNSSKGAISRVKDKNNPTPAKPISTTATFTHFSDRYDSIFLNPANGVFTIANGAFRDIDAEEYIPVTPVGAFRLANIVVTGDKIRVVPTYVKANPVVEGDLGRFYKKLKFGSAIKVLGYGDSITAIQNGHVKYQPGERNHDRYKGYLRRYPKDTINLVQRYDFNDGLGKEHCKIGWNWRLVEAIEKHGNKVEYLNCGIGSTRSDATEKHGLFPERINAALAVKPDLVVVAFGMNEIGRDRTGPNMDTIIKKFKAVGADVIVMGVPQINGTRTGNMKSWQKTINILKKAAVDNNCPFVDTSKVSLEIAPEHICSANQYNHPGISE